MTIKGLIAFLKKKSPRSFEDIDISRLNGTTIAVDISIIVYKFFKIELKKYLSKIDLFEGKLDLSNPEKAAVTAVIRHIRTDLINNNITPIIVFDGNRPEEKEKYEGARRSEKLAKTTEKYNIAKEKIEKIDISNLTEDDINTHDEYFKILCDYCSPSKGIFAILRLKLMKYGIKYIDAIYEADSACISLVNNGYAHGVYSNDSDLIARGCKLIITAIKFQESKYRSSAKRIVSVCRFSPKLLEDIKLTRDQFMDLCIMAQCDYNTNICKKKTGEPLGSPIAIARSYKLLQKYGSLEDVMKNLLDMDFSSLNYESCRYLLKMDNIEETCNLSHVKELSHSHTDTNTLFDLPD